jgi:hypothetical protein
MAPEYIIFYERVIINLCARYDYFMSRLKLFGEHIIYYDAILSLSGVHIRFI